MTTTLLGIVKKVGIYLPTDLVNKMRQIWKARYKTEGVDPKLSRIYREAIELYVESIDLDTGLPKPRNRQR